MRLRVFIAFLGVLATVQTALALSLNIPEGTASFGFLRFSLSPRSIALGGAGVALVDGIADADLNPAAAARDSGGIALGQGYPTAFAATGNYASWNIPWQDRRITVQARYLGYNNISGWSANDDSTAAYSAHALKLQAGTAGNLWGFAYGASLAFAQNNIANATYGAGLINLGLWHELPYGLAAGFSLMNADFWTSTALDGSAVLPPTAVQAGLAYSHTVPGHIRLSVAADVLKRNDEKLAFPAGVEATWQNTISARVGYPFAEPEAFPTFGLGLRWTQLSFDYEYQGNAVISGAHFWTLSIRY